MFRASAVHCSSGDLGFAESQRVARDRNARPPYLNQWRPAAPHLYTATTMRFSLVLVAAAAVALMAPAVSAKMLDPHGIFCGACRCWFGGPRIGRRRDRVGVVAAARSAIYPRPTPPLPWEWRWWAEAVGRAGGSRPSVAATSTPSLIRVVGGGSSRPRSPETSLGRRDPSLPPPSPPPHIPHTHLAGQTLCYDVLQVEKGEYFYQRRAGDGHPRGPRRRAGIMLP